MSRRHHHRLYRSAWREAKLAIASLLTLLISASQMGFLRRPKSLASALFEDTCEYVVLIIFIVVSIIITEVAITIAEVIVGEIPSLLKYGIYLADASLLLKYIIHNYRVTCKRDEAKTKS